MLTGLCSPCFLAQHKIIMYCLVALSLVIPEDLSMPYKYPALKISKQNHYNFRCQGIETDPGASTWAKSVTWQGCVMAKTLSDLPSPGLHSFISY